MSIQAKNYATQHSRQAEVLNQPHYVASLFRDLELEGMHICQSELVRGELYIIETYPVYRPNFEEGVNTGVATVVETAIPAVFQVETLKSAFGKEGLLVLKVPEDEAKKTATFLKGVKDLGLYQATEKVEESNLEDETKQALYNAFSTATSYARTILETTQRELQSARSGKAGKAFLDINDKRACLLLGVSESSILAAEGQAAESAMNRLAEKLAEVLRPNIEKNTELEVLKAEMEELRKLIAKKQ